MFRRVIEEGFSGGNFNALDEVMSPEFIENEAGPGEDRGLEGVKDIVRMLRTAFPDLHATIEDSFPPATSSGAVIDMILSSRSTCQDDSPTTSAREETGRGIDEIPHEIPRAGSDVSR